MHGDPTSKTYASIDIGTNTVTMLVVKHCMKKLSVLFEQECITRLGEGLSKTKHISPNSISRCKKALMLFKNILTRYSVHETYCVATSALRDALNQKFVLSEINSCGFFPQVITGTEEAKYVAISIKYEFPNLLNNTLCIDVGGGSTEVIVFQNNKKKDVISFNFGTIILTEKYFCNDPPKKEEINQCRNSIISNLKSMNLENFRFANIIGVGGTATTLCAIQKRMLIYDSKIIHGAIMSNQTLNKIKKLLSEKKLTAKKKIPGLHPDRAQFVQAGLLIISTIMGFLNLSSLVVCDRGLRWGVLRKNIDDNC